MPDILLRSLPINDIDPDDVQLAGLDLFDPKMRGAFVKHRVDRTKLRAGSPLRESLVAYLPLHEGVGRKVADLAEWPTSTFGREALVFSDNADWTHGPRGVERAFRTNVPECQLLLNAARLEAGGNFGTFSCWLKIIANDSVETYLFRIGIDPANSVMFGFDAGGELTGSLYKDGSLNSYVVSNGSTLLTSGGWHHLAYVADGLLADWRFYLDGKELQLLEAIGANDGSWVDGVVANGGSTDVRIIDQEFAASFWEIAICDVGLWNGRFLSEQEVRTLAREPDEIYARTRRPVLLDRFRLHPTGIPTAEAFGVPKVNQQVRPPSITSAEAFGSPRVNQQIKGPVGIASAEAFGTPRVNQQIRIGAGIPSAEAFGTLTIAQQVRPVGIASAEAFGSPRLNQQVRPTGIASAEAIGSPRVNQQVRPTGISSAEAFGVPTLSERILPVGIPSAEAFGSPFVHQQVRPSGIVSAEALGAPRVNQQIRPDGIASAEAVGVPVVGTAAQTIEPVGIPSAEAFGVPVVSAPLLILPFGIPSAEAFGLPTVTLASQPPVQLNVQLAIQTANAALALSASQVLALPPSGVALPLVDGTGLEVPAAGAALRITTPNATI